MRSLKVLSTIVPLLAIAVLMLVVAHPAYSFLPGGCTTSTGGASCTANTLVPLHWSLNSFPIQYNVNSNISGAAISGSRSVVTVMAAAFASWTTAPNTNLPATAGNLTTLTQAGSDGVNLICFTCSAPQTGFSDPSTLAVTLFTFVTGAGQSNLHGGTTQFAGQIIDADILFNPNPAPPGYPATSFTTDPGSAVLTSTANVVDMQSIAVHEVGHFFGLDHSPVANAVMFPFAPTIPRDTLSWDDVAGISSLYPGTQTVSTGSIQGTIHLQAGGGAFGAHVFADSTTSAGGYDSTGTIIRKGPIGTLTAPDGSYTLKGLPVDTYVVTAQPLNGSVGNGDVSGYASAFGQAAVQTNFTTRQH